MSSKETYSRKGNLHSEQDNHSSSLEKSPQHDNQQKTPQANQPSNSKHQQQSRTQTSSTYQNDSHQQQPAHHQSNQQQNQLSEHAKEVTEESKGFFKSAFVAPDQIIKSNHAFSFKLLLSLLVIGFLVVAILLGTIIPDEIYQLGTSKGSFVSSLVLGIILFLAVIVGATYAITRLVVKQPISFRKVLSDYVLINSVTVALLVVVFILFMVNSYSFGTGVFMLSLFLFVISGVYMIAKYSAQYDTKFSSFYGIILFLIIIFLFTSIFGESLFNQLFRNLLERLGDIFDGGGSMY
ncbi:orai family protein [Staphylococcus petrasii]|nr:orai family protein [Staphylococcus petrasii]MCI2774106.1 orai family protein [Staphylococcus petrasii]